MYLNACTLRLTQFEAFARTFAFASSESFKRFNCFDSFKLCLRDTALYKPGAGEPAPGLCFCGTSQLGSAFAITPAPSANTVL